MLFTRPTLFTELYTCWYHQRYISLTLQSFVALQLFEIANGIAGGCLLLLYKNYIVFIVVCSLKSMCTPSFVLISCCVSELHTYLSPIVMYGLRLFIVVYKN